jgi:hypothetical protein
MSRLSQKILRCSVNPSPSIRFPRPITSCPVPSPVVFSGVISTQGSRADGLKIAVVHEQIGEFVGGRLTAKTPDADFCYVVLRPMNFKDLSVAVEIFTIRKT